MGQFKARQSFLGTNRSPGMALNRSFVEPYAVLKIHAERRENLKCDACTCGHGARINARGQLRTRQRTLKEDDDPGRIELAFPQEFSSLFHRENTVKRFIR